MTNENSSGTAGVTILPPFIYLGGLIIGYALQFVWWIPIAPFSLAIFVRVLGVVVVLAGGWLMLTAIDMFRRLGTPPDPREPTTALATDGPYRFTRNPMYLGMAAVLGGLALLGNALWPLLALVPVIWWIRTQVIEREERYMEVKFGAAYREFKGRVRRWL